MEGPFRKGQDGGIVVWSPAIADDIVLIANKEEKSKVMMERLEIS